MATIHVRLDTIDKVKRFVNELVNCPYDVDLLSDRYVVDGKSIMGIFSLDLTKPIEVKVHGEETGDLLERLKPFIAE